MGSQESKNVEPSEQNDEYKECESHDSLPSTPILTPLDPRSPSTDIARTPLELILGSKTNYEDALDVTENDCNVITKNVILNLDPRSPTVEFNRTPIIVSTAVKGKPSKLNNKNFDNVRKSMIQTTPVTSIKPSKIISPKFLGSSPISVNPNVNKRRSLVGLLETNIDFTETNLDNVCKNRDHVDIKPMEALEDSTNTPGDYLNNQIEALDIALHDDSSPLVSHETLKIYEDKVEECNENEEKIEVMQQESKLEETPNIETILEEKTINITAHVKDFDKKLTNLIYQDESEDDDSIRNSNEEPKKLTTKLRVSDKPRKSEISRIPILKETYNKKIGIQCENTPPKKTDEKKFMPKMPQWDGDKTLII